MLAGLEGLRVEMKALLVEQRDTADKYRAVEKDVWRQQQILGGRDVDAAGRRQAEEALAFGQAEMLRLGNRMLEIDASVTVAALRPQLTRLMLRMEEDEKLVPTAACEARLTWLEGVMTELLASGVAQEEIAVHFHNGLRTVVMVRGERKFEYPQPAN